MGNLIIKIKGCYEVSLGDTIGVGTPEKTKNLLNALAPFDINKLAVHFHDTYDKAIPNILVALEVFNYDLFHLAWCFCCRFFCFRFGRMSLCW